LEFRLRNIDGTYKLHIDRHIPFSHSSGHRGQVIGMVSDISKEQAAVSALALSEQQFRLMSEVVPDALVIADKQGRIEFYNQKFQQVLGLKVSPLHRQNWKGLLHPADYKEMEAQALKEQSIKREVRLRDADGHYRWFLAQIRPLRNAKGEVEKWLGSATGIEELKRTQMRLEDTNRRLQMTLSAISDCYVTLDRGFNITGLNERAAKWLGRPNDELIGCSILTILRRGARHFEQMIQGVMEGPSTLVTEIKSFIHRGRWIELTAQPTGEGVAIFFQDITDRKLAEAAVQESLHFLQGSIDALSTHIAVLDETGKIVAVNRAWLSYGEANGFGGRLGANCAELYAQLPDPSDVVHIDDGVRHVLSGQKRDFRHVFHCKGDPTPWFQLRAASFGAAGTRHIIVAHEDITSIRTLAEERRRINQQLLKTQDAERRRIARELHDSTAQHITAVGLGLARLKQFANGSEAQGVLADVRQSLQEAHNELRSMTYLLHPPSIEGSDMVESLEKFLLGFSRRTGLNVRLDCPAPIVISSTEKQLSLYRIVQEALVNVSRHAKARNVIVRLRAGRNTIRVEVKDDGVGLTLGDVNGAVAAPGIGVPGMRARVEQFGGRFSIFRLRRGTKIQAIMPNTNER
jgi:PAS domain S-box-containing protein